MNTIIQMVKIRNLTLLFLILFFVFVSTLLAQSSSLSGSLKTGVVASVGELYLNLSGSASAFASIALSSEGKFVTSAAADANGNFSIANILIKRGFSNFCLTVVDLKRAGESTTCFSFPPAMDSITMKDIFLPPTLGLSSTETNFNSTVLAFGYTLPESLVTLYLSNGKSIKTVSDATGYYSIKITKLEPGKYDLYTTAQYQKKESLTPEKKVQLKSLSLVEQTGESLNIGREKVIKVITSSWFVFLIIPIIILIIILTFKLRSLFKNKPLRKTSLRQESPVDKTLIDQDKKLLHHFWWVGY